MRGNPILVTLVEDVTNKIATDIGVTVAAVEGELEKIGGEVEKTGKVMERELVNVGGEIEREILNVGSYLEEAGNTVGAGLHTFAELTYDFFNDITGYFLIGCYVTLGIMVLVGLCYITCCVGSAIRTCKK